MPPDSPHSPPKLIITVGLPGSGKSTYLEHLRVTPLASDDMRRLLLDSVDNQTANRLIFATLRHLVRVRLQLKRPATYVDATHLAPWERRPWIKIAELYGASPEALFFDIPLETCLARNRGRTRQVPEDILRTMAERLTPPTEQEGFSKVFRLGA